MEIDIQTLSRSRLQQLYETGRLPINVAGSLQVTRVAELALFLPRVQYDRDRALPAGYGLFPPRGAEPLVRLRKGTRDLQGVAVDSGAWGIVACCWHASGSKGTGRVVWRLAFRGNPLPRFPVDCYDDAILCVQSIAGKVPALTGWQIARLDTPINGDRINRGKVPK